MLDEPPYDRDVPVITLPAEIYDAVLLADAVMLVTEGGPPPRRDRRGPENLRDFFQVRRCLLTCGAGERSSKKSSAPDAELMHRMVGG